MGGRDEHPVRQNGLWPRVGGDRAGVASGWGCAVRARVQRGGSLRRIDCARDAAPVTTRANPNAFDWSGFYLGGHMGYAWGRSNFTATSTGPVAPPFAGSLDFSPPPSGWTGTGSYFAGLQAGYNLMLPSRLVVGFETDMLFPSLVDGGQAIRTVRPRDAGFDEDMLIAGTARGRLGYAIGNWLPYATAGFAWTFDRSTWTEFERDGAHTRRAPAPVAVRVDNWRWCRVSVRAELDRAGGISVRRIRRSRRDISACGRARPDVQPQHISGSARPQLPSAQ